MEVPVFKGVKLCPRLVWRPWAPEAAPTVPLKTLVPIKARLRLWSRHPMSHKV